MDARTPSVGPVAWLRFCSLHPAGGLGVWLLAGLFLGGCRADPNMQLAERELRLQDKRIFELEEHLADCHSAVAEHRREIASLRRQLDDQEPPDVDLRRDAPEGRRGPALPAEPSLPDIDEGDEPPILPRVPLLDADPSLDNNGGAGAAERPDAAITPAGDPPQPTPAIEEQGISFPHSQEPADPADGGIAPGSEELPPPDLTGAAEDVEQIGLRLVVRYQPDQDVPVQLQAFLQPQDAGSQRVPAGGDVSLMIVAAEGQMEKPLARWDFPALEAQQHWQRSRLGTGMQFHLPWPGSPRPGTFRLWARFVGEDGRKHLSIADFEIEPAALARAPELPPPAQVAEPTRPIRSAPTPRPPHVDSSGSDPHPPREAPKQEPGIAWKPSVEAARLFDARQRRQEVTIAETGPSPEEASNERRIPWSPERPARAGTAAELTADSQAEWSPYR